MTDISSGFDSRSIIEKLEKVVSGGWLIANLTERYFYCSDLLTKTLLLPGNTVKFDDVKELVHPEDKDRISVGMDMLAIYGKVKSNLRIHKYGVPEKFHSGRIQFGEVTEVAGCQIAYGFIQRMDLEEDASFNWHVLNAQYKELKYWQNSVPRLLQMLLEYKKFGEVSTEILASILDRFGADRAFLIEYDWESGTRSCRYEQIRPGIKDEKESLQLVPTNPDEWWHSELLVGNVVVVDNVLNIREGELKSRLMEMGISSTMLVPLMENGKTWGYIGVDIVDKIHKWQENEQAWFQSVGHIASVGLALRRAYSDALKEKEYLNHLQKNMPACMEVYDTDGYLIDANQNTLDLIGFGTKEYMRSLRLNIFENPFIPLEKRNALRMGERISCEFSYAANQYNKDFFKNTDGTTRNLFFEATALHDEKGRLMNYLVILSDHTEIMEAYHQLREFKKMFSIISEFSEVGFFRINLLDPELNYEATEQWFQNFNAERPQTNFASSLIPDTIDPVDAAEIGNFLSLAVNGHTKHFHKQVKALNNDGSLRWLRVHIKVVDYKPEEKQVVLFGLSVDVTQLKDVELKLIEAKTKAEESDRLKSAFLANMNHEIRTPLNAIVGFSSMIADDPVSELNKEFATLVLKNNELLLQIISDVLDLAKIEAGIFEAILTNTHVHQMCDEVLTVFTPQKGDDIEFVLHSPSPKMHVLCDRNRVVQILNKFVGNALKFTTSGKIELGYEVKQDGSDSLIEFYVSDTGIGMSLQQAKHCFSRFMKADSFVQGAGLGLSVCKELISKLNGTIGVDSEEGEGSRFWFRLPYMPANADKDIDGLTATTMDGRKPVILVAEDTVINFLLISSMLQQYYTVIVVQNGQDAVRVHAERSPDLILMDLKMPRMDGLEATRLIRQVDPETPIVAITAFAFEYDKKAAIQAGCNYVLTKPINQTQLRKIVKQLIETGRYEKRSKGIIEGYRMS